MPNDVPQRPGILCCLTTFDGESQRYMCHCLNHDIVECGVTAQEAWENLKTAVKYFIEYTYTNNPEGLKVSAEPEEWRDFFKALKDNGGQFSNVEEIILDLKPPLFDTSIWIQGVREDGPTVSHVH